MVICVNACAFVCMSDRGANLDVVHIACDYISARASSRLSLIYYR